MNEMFPRTFLRLLAIMFSVYILLLFILKEMPKEDPQGRRFSNTVDKPIQDPNAYDRYEIHHGNQERY